MRFCLSLVPGFVLLSLLSGCSSEPARLTLKGKVSLEGKPVPYGVIFFNPDAKQGNKGIQGSAQIHDGEYVTNPDYGPTSGPIIAEFQIHTTKVPAGPGVGIVPVKPVPFELTRGMTTVDFNLVKGEWTHHP